MRLIDADAMKEELLCGNVYLSDNETNAIVDLIDNQLTIDPESLRPKTPARPGKAADLRQAEKCRITFRKTERSCLSPRTADTRFIC